MTRLFARTFPAAVVLALFATASVAEDRPNTTLVQKSKSSTQKSRAQTPAAVSGEATVKAGGKQRTPAADASTPAAERSYEGCSHGKGAEA
jgi:hypothetical protein